MTRSLGVCELVRENGCFIANFWKDFGDLLSCRPKFLSLFVEFQQDFALCKRFAQTFDRKQKKYPENFPPLERRELHGDERLIFGKV